MERMTPLLIAGAFLLVGVIVYVALRAERGRRQAFREAVRSLGFIPADATPELVRRLTALHASLAADQKESKERKYKVTNVFSRRAGDAEMFIFDLAETGTDDGHAERQSLAVVSDRLRLPPFVMLPRPGGDGVLAKMADKAISWVAQKMGSAVEFPQYPEFEQHYIVRSSDPDGARRLLDGNRLGRLAEMRHVCIFARDDAFTLSTPAAGSRQTQTQPWRERVDQASRIFSILSS